MKTRQLGRSVAVGQLFREKSSVNGWEEVTPQRICDIVRRIYPSEKWTVESVVSAFHLRLCAKHVQ